MITQKDFDEMAKAYGSSQIHDMRYYDEGGWDAAGCSLLFEWNLLEKYGDYGDSRTIMQQLVAEYVGLAG